MTTRDPLARLRRSLDTETIRADLVDLIPDAVRLDDLREWVDTAEALIDQADATVDAVEEWRDEDDREARADAREDAVGALQELVDRLDEFEVWGPLPAGGDG